MFKLIFSVQNRFRDENQNGTPWLAKSDFSITICSFTMQEIPNRDAEVSFVQSQIMGVSQKEKIDTVNHHLSLFNIRKQG